VIPVLVVLLARLVLMALLARLVLMALLARLHNMNSTCA
jgi:hypothetical protein